jgi:hypothetical protein
LKNAIISRITEAKAQKPKEKELDTPKVAQAFKEAVGVEPDEEVNKTWQEYQDNEKTKLGTPDQIKQFLEENIKGKEEDFAKIFTELPSSDQPTGSNHQEKVDNFLKTKNAETVIKTVFRHKLTTNSAYEKSIQEEMQKYEEAGQILKTEAYEKKDGKFTKEAMIKYLFERQTGKAHEKMNKEQQPKEETPTTPTSHWDQWKWWYIIGAAIVLILGTIALFWNQITGANAENEGGEE